MKTIKLSGLVMLLIMFSFISNKTYSQWQQDSKYKFKINIPADWSKSSSMDGTDKIYDYYSADQNAAIQIRVFEAGGAVTTDMLAQIYEQNYLPAGTQKQGLENHTSKNGIPGKQGTYILDYNGTEVTMGSFFTVQNNIGYVLTVMIPSNMRDQKGSEVRQITQSFIIDGFEKALVIKRETEKPKKGLSGLLGGTTNNNTNNQQNNTGFSGSSSSGISSGGISGGSNNINRDDVVGRYNFSHRSDGKNMTNYHYILINENGTYVEKYNPKDSGDYVGGHEGKWKLNGDILTLHLNNSNVVDTYKVKNNFISRKTDTGLVFTFKKK
ncbi:MAG: hypothetical protein K8R41_02550 [Bacteroidales bacterium]|nr:hypothetical protein [Bacteroidales bacterium]